MFRSEEIVGNVLDWERATWVLKNLEQGEIQIEDMCHGLQIEPIVLQKMTLKFAKLTCSRLQGTWFPMTNSESVNKAWKILNSTDECSNTDVSLFD